MPDFKNVLSNRIWELKLKLKGEIQRHATMSAEKYLIELSDEELKIVSKDELEEIDKSDMEFDGFNSYRLVGQIMTHAEKKAYRKAELEKVSEESIEYNADEWANKINEYGPISESFIAGAKWLLQKLKQ